MQLPKSFNNYSIITCDVFDTLLIRDSVTPTRLWKRKGATFAVVRRSAEFLVRRMARFRGRQEIHITDIYRCMPNRWNMEDEIALEIQSLRPNPEILSWLQEASACGVTVVLVSDIYFTSNQLVEILEAVGVPCFEVITSASEGTTKSKGLFKLISSRWKIPHDKWLHIGDNFKADVLVPRGFGIQVIHYPKILEQILEVGIISKKGVRKLLNEGREGERVLTDMSLNFAQFTLEKGSRSPVVEEYVGALICAPIGKSIARFVHKTAENTSAQTVLFSGRDGWLPYLYFKANGNKMPAIYFRVSRVATTSPYFETFLSREIGAANKILVFDIGWRGSLLSHLQSLQPTIEWSGVFVALIRAEKANEFQMAKRFTRNWIGLVKNRDVIETLFSDPTAGVIGYDPSGDPLYNPDTDVSNRNLRLSILNGANWASVIPSTELDLPSALNLARITCIYPSHKLAERFVDVRHEIDRNRVRPFLPRNWHELFTEKDFSWWAGARAIHPHNDLSSLAWKGFLFFREYWILTTKLFHRSFLLLKKILRIE